MYRLLPSSAIRRIWKIKAQNSEICPGFCFILAGDSQRHVTLDFLFLLDRVHVHFGPFVGFLRTLRILALPQFSCSFSLFLFRGKCDSFDTDPLKELTVHVLMVTAIYRCEVLSSFTGNMHIMPID